MNPENYTLTAGLANYFDEPYVHAVSTAEFVEAVERESRTENDDRSPSDPDPGGYC